MRLAAIDIGSNAARLLINDVIPGPHDIPEFIKISLVRVPLRLGFDVFDKGEISSTRADKLLHTIKAYRHLLEVYDVKHLKACATSAMRDAVNSNTILRKIKEETGIKIHIISGTDEATFLYENHIAENMNKGKSYLYIDVGGGSTELSFFGNGKPVFKESFKIGTIRLLKNQVSEGYWDSMKEFIRSKTKGYPGVTAIGSGGNINKVFSMSKRKEGKPLSLEQLKDYFKEFNRLTVPERIAMYKFQEDRADVIVPALLIYINVMRWADAEEIFVPKIGLVDGLIHSLYEEVKLREITN